MNKQVGHGKAIYKNKTLTHNPQQCAQEDSLICYAAQEVRVPYVRMQETDSYPVII